MDTNALAGKIAIVTGSGRGVGRGIALALSSQGASVMVCGRTPDKLDETVREIAARGGTAVAQTCDVTQPADVQRLIDDTVHRFGTIDILVNNAQSSHGLGRLLDVEEKEFEGGFHSGPMATLRLMKGCYPHLRDGGVIVNLGTAASLRPDPIGYGCYGAVKEAIRALSRAAAVEWGPVGIRVHVVVPLSGLEDWAAERPEESKAFFATIPMGRIGSAEQDIGRVVAFLCGPDSSYMTGNSILVDGGQAFLR